MMSFEEQYHIIYPDITLEGVVILMPDKTTARRSYVSTELMSGKPLGFLNGFAEQQDAASVPEQLRDVLFDGYSFAVRDPIKERLAAFDVTGMQYYRMTYLDRSGLLHTDFWYANFFERRPFLDLDRSTILIEADEDDEDDEPIIQKFAFDAAAMRQEPEESRLLFELAGALNGHTFVHERILPLFGPATDGGFRSFRVSEFEEGMQHV
jgi:hypothetical protein